jgi:hypothetical protein
MIGGFAGIIAASGGLGFWSALLFTLLIGGMLGLIIEAISFRKFGSEETAITASLSSLAVGLLMTDLVRHRWGADPVPITLAAEFTRGGWTASCRSKRSF